MQAELDRLVKRIMSLQLTMNTIAVNVKQLASIGTAKMHCIIKDKRITPRLKHKLVEIMTQKRYSGELEQ